MLMALSRGRMKATRNGHARSAHAYWRTRMRKRAYILALGVDGELGIAVFGTCNKLKHGGVGSRRGGPGVALGCQLAVI